MYKKVRIIMEDGSKSWGYATDEHAASSHGLPVVVFRDIAYGSAELEAEGLRIICNDAVVRKALTQAGYIPEEMDVAKTMIAHRIKATLVDQIDQMALKNRQSRSSMIEILLEEALEARQKKGVK